MPNSHLLETMGDRPSLYFDVSFVGQPHPVEFHLLDAAGELIYTTSFTPSHIAGIVGIPLPPNILEREQTYAWHFSVITSENRNLDVTVQGGIKRVDAAMLGNETLSIAQISTAQISPSPISTAPIGLTADLDLLTTYQSAGLWSDAIALSINLRQHYPNSPRVQQAWDNLLGALDLSQAVNLSSELI